MNNQATDQELANFLIYHIENPCVDMQTGLNIRGFYVREAKRIVGTFKDSNARKSLENNIRKYS